MASSLPAITPPNPLIGRAARGSCEPGSTFFSWRPILICPSRSDLGSGVEWRGREGGTWCPRPRAPAPAGAGPWHSAAGSRRRSGPAGSEQPPSLGPEEQREEEDLRLWELEEEVEVQGLVARSLVVEEEALQLKLMEQGLEEQGRVLEEVVLECMGLVQMEEVLVEVGPMLLPVEEEVLAVQVRRMAR